MSEKSPKNTSHKEENARQGGKKRKGKEGREHTTPKRQPCRCRIHHTRRVPIESSLFRRLFDKYVFELGSQIYYATPHLVSISIAHNFKSRRGGKGDGALKWKNKGEEKWTGMKG